MTKIYCDIADLKQIKKFSKSKIVKGFTTNPSLIRKAGAKNYLNIDEFMKAGIELKFFHLNDFKYSQLGTKFIPKLSIMDLVFNEGPKSSEYIKANFSFEK